CLQPGEPRLAFLVNLPETRPGARKDLHRRFSPAKPAVIRASRGGEKDVRHPCGSFLPRSADLPVGGFAGQEPGATESSRHPCARTVPVQKKPRPVGRPSQNPSAA